MDLVDPIITRGAERLRELEPDAIAILVTGSYARGEADEHSDLDLRAITKREPAVRYRTWFAEAQGGMRHVSFGSYSVGHWLDASREPAWWALGFPVVYRARYVWATSEARAQLGEDPSVAHPPMPPALEGLVEAAAKVQRARIHADEVGVLLYARKVAELAPGLLIPLNEPVVVHTLREALDAACSLELVPENYREDIATCFGLTSASDNQTGTAALRLTRELLAFLREHTPEVDPQPDIAHYLADGTLERHLGFLD